MFRRRDRRKPRVSSCQSEQLEVRRVLSGYFNDLDQALTQGPGAALNQISAALRTLGPLSNHLPLLDKAVSEITQVTESLVGLTNALHQVVPGLDPSNSSIFVKTQIYNQLSTLGIVGDRNRNTSSDIDDIDVTVDTNGVDIAMNLAKSVTFSTVFGLGLNSVPFRTSGIVSAAVTVTLAYDNFAFGFRNGAFYFNTSSPNELRFQIDGKLSSGQIPSSFTAGLGFLNLSARDATLDNKDLSVLLTADVTSGAGGLTLVNPRLSGNFDLQLDLTADITTPGFPRLRTTMVVGWQFNNIDLNTGYGSFGVPTLRFDNVGMNIRSLTSGIVQTIAQKVQYVLEPFQPILDTILDPIPGISDIARAVGEPDVTLPRLASVMSQLPNPPEAFLNFVHTAEKLKEFSNRVNTLADQGGDAWIDIGSFEISGASNTTLLTAATALNNLGLSEWSSLIPTGGGGIDYNALKQQIAASLPGGIGNEINELFDQLTAKVGENGLFYDFPIVQDPTRVALSFLLGRDADLVTVSGRYHLVLDHEINISPVDGIVIIIHPALDFDAYAKAGFDTRGLRQAMIPLYSGGNFDSSALLQGFYIDNATHLNVSGSVELKVGPGIPQVNLTVGGGLSANISMTLDNSRNLQEPAKLRPFADELGDCFFMVGGSMKASAQVAVSVGGEVGGKFIGIKKSWTFAEATIFEFQTNCIPNPQELSPGAVQPVILATLSGDTLTLAMGALAGSRGPLSSATAENFTVRRFIYQRRDGWFGIRVSVSAFGMTQEFSGFDVHRIVADGGTDRDEVHVFGDFDEVRLSGGLGNDVLEYRGNGSVILNGDDGDDTLRAENGSGNTLSIQGGAGLDQIYVGAGRLDRIEVNLISGVINPGPDGGLLHFDNSEEAEDTTYEFIRPGVGDIESGIPGWQLRVSRGGPSPFLSTYRFYGGFVAVHLISGSGNDQFLGYAPRDSLIEGRAGDDICRLYDPLNTTALPIFAQNYRYTFDGGAGHDSLPMENSGATNSVVVTTETNLEGRNSISWGLTTSNVNGSVYVPNVENVTIHLNPAGSTAVRAWTGSKLGIDGGASVYVETFKYWSTLTNINVTNVPLIAMSDWDGASFSSLGIAETFLFKDLYNGRGVHINFDATAADFIIDGPDTSQGFFLVETGLADRAVPARVAVSGSSVFHGGVYVTPLDTRHVSVNHNWLIEGENIVGGNLTVQTIDIHSLSVQSGLVDSHFEIRPVVNAVNSITVTGSAGDDQFVVGSPTEPFSTAIHANVRLVGGVGGQDSAVIHDEALVGRQNYDFHYGYMRNTASNFSIGTAYVPTTFLSSANSASHFDIGGWESADWTIVSGTGDDSYWISEFDFHRGRMAIHSGGGNNSLKLDNTIWPSSNAALIYDEHIRFSGHNSFDESDHFEVPPPSPDAGSPWNARVFYEGIQSISYDGAIQSQGGNRGENRIYVVSTLSGIPVHIQGNAGSKEIVSLGTEDDLTGTLDAIRGPVTISGGFDPNFQRDSMFVTDSSATAGHSFDVASEQITRDGSRLAAMTGLFEQSLFAGSGNDQFTFYGSTFNSASAPHLTINGGSGIDQIVWDDTAALPSQIWNFENGSFGRTAGPEIYHSAVEILNVTGTIGKDQFIVLSTSSEIHLKGLSGSDEFLIGGISGLPGTTRPIAAPVIIEADGADGDVLSINNRADSAGRIVHAGPRRIGAAPGDNLFGAGGSLQWQGLNRISLGLSETGADTVFLRPDATVGIELFGGGPVSAPGDLLTVDVAGIAEYQLTPGIPGAGTLTGSFATVSFTDFETGPTFATVNAPTIIAPAPTTSDQRPRIQWESVADAESFEVWFADLNVTPARVLRETVTATEWIPPQRLDIGVYRVWIRTRTAAQQLTVWSAPRTFRINTPVALTSMTYRQNTLRPTVRWEPLGGAIRYEIQVDDTTRGVQKFVSQSNLTTSEFIPNSDWPLGNYRIWVRGIDSKDRVARWSTAISVSIAAAPLPVSPRLPTFEHDMQFLWTAVPGAVSYDLQLRNRSTGVITDYPNLTETQWNPPASLADGNWRWYVRATSEFGVKTYWSTPADFHVGGRPSILSPGALVNGLPPFRWTPVTGAARYDLMVNRVDQPSVIVREKSLTGTEFTPIHPLPIGTYRAWIRAISLTGQISPWSGVLEFQVLSEQM